MIAAEEMNNYDVKNTFDRRNFIATVPLTGKQSTVSHIAS
jgi:hypothetical protein